MDPILDPKERDLENALLKAGRDVGMSDELRTKTIAALAAGTAGVTAASTAKAGTWSWLTSKVGAISIAGLVIVGGVAGVTLSQPNEAQETRPTSVDTPTSASPSQRVPPPTEQVEAQASPTSAPEPGQAEPAEKLEKPVLSPKPKNEPSAASPSLSAPTLSDELSHISKVESALRGGAPNQALQLLSDYRQKFTKRRLGLEAEVLTIQALHDSGSVAAASARAAKFLKRHPKSPLGARAKQYVK